MSAACTCHVPHATDATRRFCANARLLDQPVTKLLPAGPADRLHGGAVGDNTYVTLCEACGERPALDGVKPLLNSDLCCECATEIAYDLRDDHSDYRDGDV